MWFRSKWLLLSVVALLIVPFSSAQEMEKETFLLTYIPNIQFAPIYVAIEAGYFADGNMDVALDYLNEPDVLDLVASGQNDFGIVSAEQVILAGAQGRPITYVYNWFQKYPVGIVVNADSGIETVKDLKDKKVGIPGRFGASYTGLTTLLLANDMTESDIQLEEIGFNAPEVFCLGQVDAAVVYINNEPLQIQNRALNGDCGELKTVKVFAVSDSLDLVSNGIITNQDLIKNNPTKVQNFVQAYHQGLSVTINNPANAYLLSAAHIENLPLSPELKTALEQASEAQLAFLETNPDRDAIATSRQALHDSLHALFDNDTLLQFDILLNTIALWDANELGVSSVASWDNMLATLQAMNAITTDVDLTTLYTNEFIPNGE